MEPDYYFEGEHQLLTLNGLVLTNKRIRFTTTSKVDSVLLENVSGFHYRFSSKDHLLVRGIGLLIIAGVAFAPLNQGLKPGTMEQTIMFGAAVSLLVIAGILGLWLVVKFFQSRKRTIIIGTSGGPDIELSKSELGNFSREKFIEFMNTAEKAINERRIDTV